MTQTVPSIISLSRVRPLLSWIPIVVILTSTLCCHVTLASSFEEAAKYIRRPWCLRECCNIGTWISCTNSTGLKQALRMQLFGQHLVSNNVLGAVRGHLTDSDPAKPLVLSFHGRTGTGKNYVARLIAESIYSKGMNSKFVHMFSANNDFPHKSKLDEYKNELKTYVSQHVASCPYQLFIFDEIEDMPQGLLDIIKPFLDYNVHVGHVDYRKAIFIFLSNTGSLEIINRVHDHLSDGGDREDITLKEMEEVLEHGALNEEGGFRHSRLINNNVISHFVPFLPLERRHVRECIQTQFRRHGHRVKGNKVLVDRVLEHLQFSPKPSNLFALKGCKNVDEKVTLVLYRAKN